LVNDARRRFRRYFAAGTPQPSTTVGAKIGAGFNDVRRNSGGLVNDWCRKKSVKSHMNEPPATAWWRLCAPTVQLCGAADDHGNEQNRHRPKAGKAV
jgi:hypothetical protein